MRFQLDASYTVYRVIGAASICEQGGAFYVVRIEWTQATPAAAVPCTTLGPYASADEAATHAGELPESPAPSPPPLPGPGPIPPPLDEEPPA